MGALLIKGARKLLNRDGTINGAVEDMLDSPFNALLQQEKCDVLHGLVSQRFGPGRARLHQHKIGKAGGVEAVLAVCTNHNNELALRAACRLLAEFARDEENSERMRVGNAAEILEKVAKDNYDDEYIMEDIRKAQENMVRSGAHLEHAHIRESMERKQVAPVVRALVNQSANVSVQVEGLDALWNLCRDEEQNREVRENGGLAPVIAALTTHQANVEIMRKAYGAVNVLAKSVENSNIMGKTGVIAGLLLAFKNHREDFKLLQQVIWALNELAKHGANLERMVDQGVGSVLRYCKRDADACDPPVKLVVPLKLKRLVKKAEAEADSDDEDSGSDSEDEVAAKLKADAAAKKALEDAAAAKPPPRDKNRFRR